MADKATFEFLLAHACNTFKVPSTAGFTSSSSPCLGAAAKQGEAVCTTTSTPSIALYHESGCVKSEQRCAIHPGHGWSIGVGMTRNHHAKAKQRNGAKGNACKGSQHVLARCTPKNSPQWLMHLQAYVTHAHALTHAHLLRTTPFCVLHRKLHPVGVGFSSSWRGCAQFLGPQRFLPLKAVCRFQER